MRTLNSLTYDYKVVQRTIPVGVSMTVPDMALTIHEILARFTRNQSVPQMKGNNVEGDVSHLDKLNQFELIDLKRDTDTRVLDLRKQVLSEMETKRKHKSEAAFKRAVDAEVLKRSQNAPEATRADEKS